MLTVILLLYYCQLPHSPGSAVGTSPITQQKTHLAFIHVWHATYTLATWKQSQVWDKNVDGVAVLTIFAPWGAHLTNFRKMVSPTITCQLKPKISMIRAFQKCKVRAVASKGCFYRTGQVIWHPSIATCITVTTSITMQLLVAWYSGRTLVFDQLPLSLMHSTCSWWVTTYVGKPSAVGQPTRPTQPFIPSG